MNAEIQEYDWKDIPGLDGYQATKTGEIRSYWLKNKRVENPRIMVKTKMTIGYYSVSIRERPHYVHRLVAQTFIENPENKRTVNHKDGNKTNNNVSNLEWMTYQEQQRHKHDVLKIAMGEKCPFSKLTLNDVCDIKSLHAFGAKKSDLAEIFNVNFATIYDIIKGRTWGSSFRGFVA